MGRLASGERQSQPTDFLSTRSDVEATLKADLFTILGALSEEKMLALAATLEKAGDKATADLLVSQWLAATQSAKP